MKIKKMLHSFFGYTRSERLGSLVLVLIISAVIITRLCKSRDYALIKSGEQYLDSLHAQKDSMSPGTYFFFDPNTLGRDSLLMLGLSGKQASTLISYRESGARFRDAEDFRKVYGIDVAVQDSLIPYIKIRESSGYRKNITRNQEKGQTAAAGAIHNATSESPEPESFSGPGTFKPLDLNTADSALLTTIPGIGRVLGPRIVKYRSLLGGFYSPGQLAEVYGIDSSRAAAIKDYIIIDTSQILTLDLNSSGYAELIRHPYISRKNTEDILRYRAVNNCITSFSELIRNHLLEESQLEKLKPYLVIKDSVIISR